MIQWWFHGINRSSTIQFRTAYGLSPPLPGCLSHVWRHRARLRHLRSLRSFQRGNAQLFQQLWGWNPQSTFCLVNLAIGHREYHSHLQLGHFWTSLSWFKQRWVQDLSVQWHQFMTLIVGGVLLIPRWSSEHCTKTVHGCPSIFCAQAPPPN